MSDATSPTAAALPPDQLARTAFEVSNDIVTVAPENLVFAYDAASQAQLNDTRPWLSDPKWFQLVRVSAVALIKMVIHAKSGGDLEVMGMMQGKVDAATRTLYVMDAFALPVEGTETRVNAQAEAYEYMVQYNETSHQVYRPENVVGWYHSHPGYGCWLSGIDVTTQELNQTYSEPWLAIVIDPKRTLSAGKVDMGAFRTLPVQGASATGEPKGKGYQFIPSEKQADFGVHANRYYALPIEIFKSSTDTAILNRLWHKYWVATLADSPLVSNSTFYVGQVADFARRLQGAQDLLAKDAQRTDMVHDAPAPPGEGKYNWRLLGTGTEPVRVQDPAKAGAPGQVTQDQTHQLLTALREHRDRPPLQALSLDAGKVVDEAHYGLVSQVIKDQVFNASRAGVQFPV